MNLYLNENIAKFSGGAISLPGPNGLNSFNSQMNFSRIFCGEYLDDFCLGALFSPPDSRDLILLGASIGSAIRPAYSVREFDRIYCIDIDRTAIEVSKSIFRQMRGFHHISWRKESAVNFLSNSNNQFHGTVLIDLFDQHGHARDCFIEHDCLEMLADRVSEDSVIQMNVYTVPTFLGIDSRPLQFFLSKGVKNFKYIRIFPYRRNVSILFSKTPLRTSANLKEFNLKSDDDLMLSMKRVFSASNFSLPDFSQPDEDAILFSSIRREFRERHIRFSAGIHQKYRINLLDQNEEPLFFKDTFLRNTLQSIAAERDVSALHFIIVSLAAQPERLPSLDVLVRLTEVAMEILKESDLSHMADQICALAVKLMAVTPQNQKLLISLIHSIRRRLSCA